MTSTIEHTGELRLGPYVPTQSLNLAVTERLNLAPLVEPAGVYPVWTPRTDPQDPDLHCPTEQDVDQAEAVRHAAEIVPDPPLVLAEVLRPYSGEVLPQLPRGRRRGRGRASGMPEWLLIVLCGFAGTMGGGLVLVVAVIQAVTR